MDVYLCEANKEENIRIKEYCVRYFINENLEADVLCADSLEALREALSENVLLNIFMVDVNMEIIALTDYIKQCNLENYIILLGRNPQTIFSYITPSLRPSGILLCPTNEGDVNQLLQEIWVDYQLAKSEESQFAFQIQASHYKVPFCEIVFFESSMKKILLRTSNQEFEFYGSLQEMEAELPPAFMRIHRSYIINTGKIQSVDFAEKTVILKGDIAVVFSRRYKTDLQQVMEG